MSALVVQNPPASAADADASLRLPVMIFFGAAIFWLIVGACLALISAWKLVDPSFLDGISWLTYGRIQPAAENSLIYGWASQAGIGAGLWLLARLGRTALAHSKLLISAAIFWNVGVLAGVCGIVAGRSSSFEGLEFPGFASAILLVAYALIGIWSLVLLRNRSSGAMFASQWYLLAAFLWFPWFYATANMLLVWNPIQGSAQGPIAWWFGNNLIWLWLAPIALASAYYVIPHEQGRPIRAYSWSVLAFWGVAFLGGWTGTRSLVGGPVPAWLVSAGVAASILMLIPATLIGINTFGTVSGPVKGSVLSFTLFGLACMAFVVFQNAASPFLAGVTQFTDYTTGISALLLLGSISMILFGAMYFIVPRLMGLDLNPQGALWHFWLAVVGLATIIGSLCLGGLIQGFALGDIGVTFATAVNFVAPFRFLRALGALVFLLGALAFAAVFVELLLRKADVLPPAKKKGLTR